MDQFFLWLESTEFSTWMRESPSLLAFPTILTLHSIGMAFLAGISAAIDLRIFGFAPRVPLLEMRRFVPLLWASFWLSAVTGVALVLTYPTKALTNPIFYVKLTLIALALFVLRLIRRHVLQDEKLDFAPVPAKLRVLAAVSLAAWIGVLVAGRFLPYTYLHLLAG
jgi:hypothetical protein